MFQKKPAAAENAPKVEPTPPAAPPPVQVAPPPPRPEPPRAPPIVVGEVSLELSESEPEAPPPRPSAAPAGEERLISSATAAASVAALSRLADLGQRGIVSKEPLDESGRTLESLVRELLRPMLKTWLDDHLPPIVERLVREEIQRMSRDAQGR
jgi:hypothetical protein